MRSHKRNLLSCVGIAFWFMVTGAQQDGDRNFILGFVCGDWGTTRWRSVLRFGFCWWRLKHNKMASGTSFHYQLRTRNVTLIESTWP
jgi:hypothetical protein